MFGAMVYLHAADRQWVMLPSPLIEFWAGESLKDGLPYVLKGSLAKVPRSNRGTIEL